MDKVGDCLYRMLVFNYQTPIKLKKLLWEILCNFTISDFSDFSDDRILNWDFNEIFWYKSHLWELPLNTNLGFYFSSVYNVLNSEVSLLT